MRAVIFLACNVLITGGCIFARTGVGPIPGDEFTGPFPSWSNLRTTYGAIGDGINDDTSAVQAAFNVIGSETTSPVLYIPVGTYRITRTLTLARRSYIAIIGEDPANTILKWDGIAGGVMLNLNGVVDSRLNRVTFDGSHSAAVAVDQSWDGQGAIFDIHNEYADDIFQNAGIGLRCGHLGAGAADSAVVRSRFLRNSIAGISIENWNALNWYIRSSYFQDNYVGITNTLGAGNFHVHNSTFQHSIRADIEITNLEFFSFRHNFSTGSGYFLLANPIGSGPNPLTFQEAILPQAALFHRPRFRSLSTTPRLAGPDRPC